MRTRLPRLLAAAIAALAIAGCGGEDTGDQAGTATTPTPAAETEAQAVQSVDGYLISAEEQSVAIRAQDGPQTFSVDPADLEAVGIPHLASHAGLTDVGFRVYYVERDGERFIKGSEEIAPPF